MQLNYNWTLAGAKFTRDKGKVFSCFACGGGSTMGYKLAGFDVIGCNEIDPKMGQAYIANHKPKYAFIEPIQHFKLRDTRENLLKTYGSEGNIIAMGGWDKWLMPEELYDLDALDGSPPCSSFSMVGNREKDWGKNKKFAEGQAEQVLDTLFFDFIDLAKKLQPKAVVAENVKGIMMGEAWKYMREIYKQFDEAGYYVRHWLLDASDMGVPQRRERVFFVALRKDLADPFMEEVDLFTQAPALDLVFNEPKINFSKIDEGSTVHREKVTGVLLKYLQNVTKTGILQTSKPSLGGELGGVGFSYMVVPDYVPLTVISNTHNLCYHDKQHYITDRELRMIGSYPQDYNFLDNREKYLIGMSVPPIMVAQIATRIHEQWLSRL